MCFALFLWGFWYQLLPQLFCTLAMNLFFWLSVAYTLFYSYWMRIQCSSNQVVTSDNFCHTNIPICWCPLSAFMWHLYIPLLYSCVLWWAELTRPFIAFKYFFFPTILYIVFFFFSPALILMFLLILCCRHGWMSTVTHWKFTFYAKCSSSSILIWFYWGWWPIWNC